MNKEPVIIRWEEVEDFLDMCAYYEESHRLLVELSPILNENSVLNKIIKGHLQNNKWKESYQIKNVLGNTEPV